MCGIAGSTQDPDGRAVRAMCATLRHRGPDDEGVHGDPASGVTIGARRLAVMDIAGGHQPLCNEDATVWAAFNGEIYNHSQAPRGPAPARAQAFPRTPTRRCSCICTRSTARRWCTRWRACSRLRSGTSAGGGCCSRATASARSRCSCTSTTASCCSPPSSTSLLEVKPQLRELDPYAIDAFFVFAYVPGPGTVVPGVRQLAPGHLLSWEREHGCRRARLVGAAAARRAPARVLCTRSPPRRRRCSRSRCARAWSPTCRWVCSSAARCWYEWNLAACSQCGQVTLHPT